MRAWLVPACVAFLCNGIIASATTAPNPDYPTTTAQVTAIRERQVAPGSDCTHGVEYNLVSYFEVEYSVCASITRTVPVTTTDTINTISTVSTTKTIYPTSVVVSTATVFISSPTTVITSTSSSTFVAASTVTVDVTETVFQTSSVTSTSTLPTPTSTTFTTTVQSTTTTSSTSTATSSTSTTTTIFAQTTRTVTATVSTTGTATQTITVTSVSLFSTTVTTSTSTTGTITSVTSVPARVKRQNGAATPKPGNGHLRAIPEPAVSSACSCLSAENAIVTRTYFITASSTVRTTSVKTIFSTVSLTTSSPTTLSSTTSKTSNLGTVYRTTTVTIVNTVGSTSLSTRSNSVTSTTTLGFQATETPATVTTEILVTSTTTIGAITTTTVTTTIVLSTSTTETVSTSTSTSTFSTTSTSSTTTSTTTSSTTTSGVGATATLYTLTGRLILRDSSNNNVGYVRKTLWASTQQFQYGTDINDALLVTFSASAGPNSVSTSEMDIVTINSEVQASYQYMGVVADENYGSADLSSGSVNNFQRISPSNQTPPGSTPQSAGSSTNTGRLESALWSFNTRTLEITIIWINTDGTPYPLQFGGSTNAVLYSARDATAWNNNFFGGAGAAPLTMHFDLV